MISKHVQGPPREDESSPELGQTTLTVAPEHLGFPFLQVRLAFTFLQARSQMLPQLLSEISFPPHSVGALSPFGGFLHFYPGIQHLLMDTSLPKIPLASLQDSCNSFKSQLDTTWNRLEIKRQ